MNNEQFGNSRESNVHVTTYMLRGAKYAPTSTLAILAGYFMQARTVTTHDLLLLGIPALASIHFFICYANRFHPSDSFVVPRSVVGTTLQSEAVWIFPIFVLIPYSLLVPYFLWNTDAVSIKLLLAFMLYIALSLSYGRFLVRYIAPPTLPLVRHHLIWPVVLSIALGLYYGLSFSDFKASFFAIVPVGLIVVFFSLSERLSGKAFAIVTILGYAITTTFAVLSQIGYLPSLTPLNLSLIVFCISAAAYLAVFESWRITSDLAKGEAVGKDLGQSEHVVEKPRKSSEYATATLAALTVSVGLMPFCFVFSSYGSYFLILFAIHAFLAFAVWFYRGKTPYLERWQWATIKIVAGAIFIVLLVAAPVPFLNKQFTFRFMTGFAGWVGIGILLIIVVILVTSAVRDFDKLRDEGKEQILIELFEDRINFVRMLSLICLVLCLIITGLLQSIDQSSRLYPRGELAFQIYALCIVLCLVIAAFDHFRNRPKVSPMLKAVLGFFLLIRVFTSVMIGLVVVLPSRYAGRGLADSMMSALPFFLAAAGGFALNDFYDVVKDRVSKPYRAIPSGKLSSRLAVTISIVLLATALLIIIFKQRTTFELVIYLSTIAGVVTYNCFVRYLTVSKAFLTSAVSTLPILYVVVILKYPSIYLLLPVATSLFLLGREFLMDIRDIDGDQKARIRTVPIIWGKGLTARIGFLCLLAGVGLTLVFSANTWSIRNLYFSSIASVSVATVGILWLSNSERYQRAIILSLWIPMLCGILMLIR
jgi:4-hydroxybenzoate polyprenyltransferase